MNSRKVLPGRFFQQEGGAEPVRDWLLTLSSEDRKAIGDDIRTAELGWPLGMPLCRPMGKGLFEVRSNLSNGRIARVFFCAHDGAMVLLHGFIKKTRATPPVDLELARKRMRGLA